MIESFDSAGTRALGRRFGLAAKPGLVIALSGDLGAGKTVFAKGFAEGLGVSAPVTSPTFTLLQLYESGRLPLCHMDAYRLEEEEELEAVGGHEYFGPPWVSLVEWPENVAGLLPPETLWIRIERDLTKGPDYRKITVSGEVPDDDPGH
ncbi:MAG: tRNA (adenosine(37)-N6)-threonylcarbamoyltransferase complex ATPase subunit type 1 TsaE [Lachnospiraceae bacterium]|nr:tRNA (adenosine(37)-N6)-threonylcarbamoyltransferase complex ATPase subunit type 1 TsaE [Lachnospiraceae bacterium]